MQTVSSIAKMNAARQAAIQSWKRYAEGQVRPVRLFDGTWGVIGPKSEIVEGKEITVHSRYSSWTATVSEAIQAAARSDIAIGRAPKAKTESPLDKAIDHAYPAKVRCERTRTVGWGAIVPLADAKDGNEITVTTRAGKTFAAKIVEVIESGKTAARCRTAKVIRQRSRKTRSSSRGRLVGIHTSHHCSCGNWSGAGSPCLYSYAEAKENDEHRVIQWQRS